MTLTADTLIITAMVVSIAVWLGLVISIWRGLKARRALKNLQGRMQERDEELHTLVATNQQLVQEFHERDLKIGTLHADTANLRQRLEERAGQLDRLAGEHQHLNASHSKLRDELGRSNVDSRGQAVALEQAGLQIQDKRAELDALKTELVEFNTRHNNLVLEHTQLQTQQREREDRHTEQIELLNETRENLKKEFENLANKIFEDKGKSFTTTSKDSLEALLQALSRTDHRFPEPNQRGPLRVDQGPHRSGKRNTESAGCRPGNEQPGQQPDGGPQG